MMAIPIYLMWFGFSLFWTGFRAFLFLCFFLFFFVFFTEVASH